MIDGVCVLYAVGLRVSGRRMLKSQLLWDVSLMFVGALMSA
jgi:hypothetical protein